MKRRGNPKSRQTPAPVHVESPIPGAAASIPIQPLTDEEVERMRHCERILHEGLTTFFEVGCALLTIRERHLYRSAFPTFELYCKERWGIGRSYAWRVIGAAERLRLLPPEVEIQRPVNEFQMRPFLKLTPEEFPHAWNEVVSRAKGGKVTPELLACVVGELSEHHGERRSVRGHGKKHLASSVSLGRVLTLLQEAKQRLAKGELEELRIALENIECALFK
jgi:hypothetical protein